MTDYLQCKIAAWTKKTKTDKTYFSLKVEIDPATLEKMVKEKRYTINSNIFFVKSEGNQPNYKTIDVKNEQ